MGRSQRLRVCGWCPYTLIQYSHTHAIHPQTMVAEHTRASSLSSLSSSFLALSRATATHPSAPLVHPSALFYIEADWLQSPLHLFAPDLRLFRQAVPWSANDSRMWSLIETLVTMDGMARFRPCSRIAYHMPCLSCAVPCLAAAAKLFGVMASLASAVVS
jgi:hypothetical protein